MRRFLKLTHICTQCKYGRPFKKETDICTSICAEDLRLRRCTASSPCVYVKRFEKKYGKKRHPQTAQTGGTYDKDLKITIPGTPSKKSAEIAPRRGAVKLTILEIFKEKNRQRYTSQVQVDRYSFKTYKYVEKIDTFEGRYSTVVGPYLYFPSHTASR